MESIENEWLEEHEPSFSGKKFQWRNRIALIELLANELAENGGKFDIVLRSVKLSDYSIYPSRISIKQKQALKKEVLQRTKDLTHMRQAANVGDTVRVPKLKPNLLLGGEIREGRRLVEAIIIAKVLVAGVYRYTVSRLEDGQEQKGNGHMIKAIVARVNQASE